jgi:hypothetical protein
LTIEENVLPYTFGITYNSNNQNVLSNSKNKKDLPEMDIVASSISMTASLDNALPSVAQLANGALVDICTLVGPILSNKYIMKQVYKIFLKESPTLNFLMQSILAVGK